MTQSASIGSHLPYLRRFARALTGNQRAGDTYAIATLEAIAKEPGGTKPVTRQSLFRIFLKIWRSATISRRGGEKPDSHLMRAADRTLEALTPLPRVAFLLRSLEGFTTAEAAEILDVSQTEVQDLLDAAGREIAAQLRTDVLIIEDEPIIAMDLEAMVTDLGHSVLHITRTHKEAVAAVADRAPGLVLADIQLADGSSGLDAVNDILTSCEVPVVFITAYPERLLTGQRPEPTFLITKPFRPDTVKAIISQALFFDRKAALAKAAVAS